MTFFFHQNEPPMHTEAVPIQVDLVSDYENNPFFAPRSHHHSRGPGRGHHHHHGHHHPPFGGWGGSTHRGLYYDHHHRPRPDHDQGLFQSYMQPLQRPISWEDFEPLTTTLNAEPCHEPSANTENETGAEQDKGVNSACNKQDTQTNNPSHCHDKGKHAHRGRHAHEWGQHSHHHMGRGGRGGPRRGHGGYRHREFGGFGLFGEHGRPFGGAGEPIIDPLSHFASQFGFPPKRPSDPNVDFIPSVDLFETPENYILHVSIPGVRKEDVGIDYDANESVLNIGGVVLRPNVTPELNNALVMEERSRELGVFERSIRLGTRQVPARVVADKIIAKLEDGVLNITIPKNLEPEPKKNVTVEDCNDYEKSRNEDEKQETDEESHSTTLTPYESEESDPDEDEDAKEFVKVHVQ